VQNESTIIRTLELGSISLSVKKGDDEMVYLEPQTPDERILSTLVHIYPEPVARLALDLVFGHWFQAADLHDAMNAYVSRPLANPPEEYVQVCWNHDFSLTDVRQLSAIILAGSKDPRATTFLLSILDKANSDVRDGPLYAASASKDYHVVCKVAQLAMESSANDAENRLFVKCFKRWLKNDVVSEDELNEILQKFERSHPQFLKARDLLSAVDLTRW
jgi:hypothetical protein